MSVLKWSVVVLIILNVFLLFTLWRKPSFKPMPHGPREGGPAEMIIKELHFKPEQISEFEKLKEEHHSGMIKLMEEGKGIRARYFDLLKADKADSILKDSLQILIAGNQQEIEAWTFDHFTKVRAMCDPEQKQKFDEIINEVLKHMNGPRHGGPPPHH